MELCSYEELVEFIHNSFIEFTKASFYLQEEFKKENIDNNINIDEWFINKYKTNLISLNKLLFNLNKNLHSLSIHEDKTIYTNHYFEIPVYFPSDNYLELDYSTRFSSIHDKTNDISYTINNKISPEFSLLMFNHLRILYPQHTIDDNNFTPFDVLFNAITDYGLTSQTNVLSSTFDEIFTLKITTKKSKTLQEFQKLANAFLFQIMLKCNVPCEYYSNLTSLLGIYNNNKSKKQNLNTLSTTPQRIYRDHIIDYYSLALSSNEPFAQYLSYYHVLEYFFDEVFNQHLRKQFQDKITSPYFDNKDDKELDKVINFIKKETRNCKESGQGNELESLKLVLIKFIEIDDLQEKLTPEQIKYYQQHKITFSSAQTISFKDEKIFYAHLAQRIYQTCNALVHSKEGNVGRYKPYQDNEELQKEIPLIKLVAEQVIINSSTPL
ncbi:unnamed protein product [Commensalibacter papalotli (ex Botero et al. 2024)]|uniref:Apea-like HEPN domain-containing protein n=2 Tax=Commensalibacter papalotli (ex Botero et al. 2024) TaxID=2972766 RepID=A0ABM9HIE4_9PROT|nr:unnamed protein product [Commensalibacter papalotli (ex Botero et al. 2024)]CAI3929141.1 unnamed protein product [Commensalibacter papalotli (ex Botero et al. 2024)]